MYLSIELILEALENLKDIHPFYGTTFLACKSENLPVGREVPFAISEIETNLIKKYYQPDKSSEYFYTAFFTVKKDKHWLKLKKYASSTLQGTRTQSVFKDAFIHESGSREWGWQTSYLSVLKDNLNQNKGDFSNERIPAFYLSAWLFRNTDWGENPNWYDLIQKFLSEFNISEDETLLFDLESPRNLPSNKIFTSKKTTYNELKKVISSPPDAKPETGGSLDTLEIRGVGPANEMELFAAPRLNLFTGDNGLGKTFILETAWWALTGEWTSRNAIAQPNINMPKSEPRIRFQIASEISKTKKSSFKFDWRSGQWIGSRKRDTLAGLTIYARIDGSYAIWDPTGNLVSNQVSLQFSDFLNELSKSEKARFVNRIRAKEQIVLDNKEVFEGSRKFEGLLRDWVKWQNTPDRYPFAELCKVLKILSPPDMRLEPGAIQDSLFTHLEIPTIKHPYGDVPIIHTSAAIKRVISLAYLIVWTWNEHLKVSEQMREEPQRRMVILIDELEAHLHPQWQRRILPALVEIGKELSSELKIQYLISTHSPMVMASAEPIFDEEIDKQFHLDISKLGEVNFEEVDFIEYGLIDYWLVSPTFNLKQPRNFSAENWIEKAQEIQLEENPNKDEIIEISKKLSETLAEIDPFWVRWVFFAERYNIEL
jgi:predicted ATPase